MKTKRGLIIATVVVVIVAVIYYRFYLKKESSTPILREVSTTSTYKVPNGENNVRFTLLLNSSGVVVGVKSTDIRNSAAINEKLTEFSNNLLVIIKGKKLSELTAVDRVGKSSITTTAFNNALGALKAQI